MHKVHTLTAGMWLGLLLVCSAASAAPPTGERLISQAYASYVDPSAIPVARLESERVVAMATHPPGTPGGNNHLTCARGDIPAADRLVLSQHWTTVAAPRTTERLFYGFDIFNPTSTPMEGVTLPGMPGTLFTEIELAENFVLGWRHELPGGVYLAVRSQLGTYNDNTSVNRNQVVGVFATRPIAPQSIQTFTIELAATDARAPGIFHPLIDAETDSFACNWRPPDEVRTSRVSNIELLDSQGSPAAFIDPAGSQVLQVFYQDWDDDELPVEVTTIEGERLPLELQRTVNDFFATTLTRIDPVTDPRDIDPTDDILQVTAETETLSIHVGDDQPETISSARDYPIANGRQILTEIAISKTTPDQQVAVGDIVSYRIELANNSSLPITDATLMDRLPRGFRLLERTITLDGVTTPASPGQHFQLPLGTLAPGESHHIEYAAQVLPSAIGSPAINSAQVTGQQGGIDIASATVFERVYVHAPLFHEDATILGQVFADCDGDGERGQTEAGLAGTAIRLLNGRQVLTDAEGKFSFGRVHPGKTLIWLPDNASHTRQLLDPIAGEIRRVDFAVADCDAGADLQQHLPTAEGNTETPTPQWTESTKTFEFVDVPARVAGPTATLVVKSPLGTTVELRVNDQVAGPAHAGNRWQNDATRTQYLEFVGVPLSMGENNLQATLTDAFGAARGTIEAAVVRSGEPFTWRMDSPRELTSNPGRAQQLGFSLLDQRGHQVAQDLPVTVTLTGATWGTPDADPLQNGLQTRTAQGVLNLDLLVPPATHSATLQINSGNVTEQFDLKFKPEQQTFALVGLLEAGHAKRHSTAGRDEAISEKYYQPSNTDQRAAVFAQGEVSENYHLTLVWDSAKPRQDDWQNSRISDTDYHSYGDQSQSLTTGQSSRKLFARLEGEHDWYQIGDLTPQQPFRQARASRYQRRAFGIQQHWQRDGWRIDSFAAEADEQEIVEEFRARGTSGPFQLNHDRIQRGRETVEVIVRSRFGVETDVRTLAADDYRLEYLSGRLLLTEPLAAGTGDGGEVYLRVRYHVDERAPAYYDIYGASVSRQFGPANIGVNTAVETGGGHDYLLSGLQLEYQLGPGTVLFADAARSRDTGSTAVSGVLNNNANADDSGHAQYVSLRHRRDHLTLDAEFSHAEDGYVNSGAAIPPGVLDAKIDAQVQLKPAHDLQLNASHTEVDGLATVSAGVSDAGRGIYSYQPGAGWGVDVGLGFARFERDASSPNETGVSFESRYLYGGLRYQPARLKNLSLSASMQQDFDSPRRAIGSQIRYALGERSDVWLGWKGRNQMDRQDRPDDSHFDSEWGFGLEHRFSQNLRLSGGMNTPNGLTDSDRAALGLEYNNTELHHDWDLSITGERILDLGGNGRHGYGFSSQLTQADNGQRYTRVGLEWEHGTQQRTTLLAEVVRSAWRDWAWLIRTRLEDSRGSTRQRRDVDVGFAYRPQQRDRWSILASADLQQDDNAQHVTLRLNGERALTPKTFLNLRLASRSSRHTEPYSAANRQLLVAARLRHQLTERLRLSGFVSHTRAPGEGSSAEGYGLDVRTELNASVGVTVGYNRFAYRDRVLDVSSEEHRGWFVSLDAVFDQNTLTSLLGRLR